jgi:hypothetical protein
MLMVGKSDFEVSNPNAGIPGQPATIKTNLPARNDFVVTLPLNFGGSGAGFDLQPSIGFGDVTSLGLYLGFAYHLELNPKLYLDFGLGPQIRYWLSQSDLAPGVDLDLGADIQARLPIGATYYAAKDLGLFGELGLGFGATGAAYSAAGTTTDFKAGTGYAFDIGVGVRWP